MGGNWHSTPMKDDGLVEMIFLYSSEYFMQFLAPSGSPYRNGAPQNS